MRSLIVVVLLACGGSKSPPAPAPVAPKVAVDLGIDGAHLRAHLPKYLNDIGGDVEYRKLSGYVMVAQHDRVLYSSAFGFADRSTRRLPTADTSFRIGSVTKQFTAAAILKLEQDGKLAVTDRVDKHLPKYRGPAAAVTIHQLLTHTAGVPSYTSDLAVLLRKAERWSVEDLLATFESKPLEFEPGTKFAYSNSGYALLGAVIESASGKPYAAYLDETLFKPAKLTRTVVGDALNEIDRAEGYQIQNGDIVPADPIDMSLPYAAGAIRSTANDLVRWHRALQGDAILGAAARAKLYRAEQGNYAYGWVAQDVKGKKTVWHNGGIDGFHCIVWRIPDADLVVVAWSNTLEVSTDKIGKTAIEVALGGTPEPAVHEKPGTLDPAIVARVVGSYELTDDAKAKLVEMKAQQLVDQIATLVVTSSPIGIVAKPKGQGPIELAPMADGSFYDADHDIRLRFELPATWGTDPAQQATLSQGKLAVSYRRK